MFVVALFGGILLFSTSSAMWPFQDQSLHGQPEPQVGGTEVALMPDTGADTLKMLTRPELIEVHQLLVSLKCGTCHIENDQGYPNDMFAPAFAQMSRRMDTMRVEAIAEFLLDPQRVAPGVNMPSYWGSARNGNAVAVRGSLFTTPRAQTYAVARYIYFMSRRIQEEP
jgi:hypothetical protein